MRDCHLKGLPLGVQRMVLGYGDHGRKPNATRGPPDHSAVRAPAVIRAQNYQRDVNKGKIIPTIK
jgi:hypothetical protein